MDTFPSRAWALFQSAGVKFFLLWSCIFLSHWNAKYCVFELDSSITKRNKKNTWLSYTYVRDSLGNDVCGPMRSVYIYIYIYNTLSWVHDCPIMPCNVARCYVRNLWPTARRASVSSQVQIEKNASWTTRKWNMVLCKLLSSARRCWRHHGSFRPCSDAPSADKFYICGIWRLMQSPLTLSLKWWVFYSIISSCKS